MPSRRTLLAASLALPALARPARAAADLAAQIAALETRQGGRLGVALLDTGSGRRFGHRAAERFPICSTYKFLAAACVLAAVDAGRLSLGQRITYGPEKVVTYSPVTAKHVGPPGLALGDICAAAVTLSDNTAGNLMLGEIGGPAGLTRWLRGIGDGVTRLDRWETALNDYHPGDPRDTTTPQAMLADLQRLLLGPVLSPASRHQLMQWMLADQVGAARLKAGLPAGWRIGDKTGSGAMNATNDIGILWPPAGAPILVAVYAIGLPGDMAARNAVIAEIGQLISRQRT
ncbi:class A beta-lactamase [Acidisoma sp. C75]